MPSFFSSAFSLLTVIFTQAHAVAIPNYSAEGSVAKRSAYPFNQLVAFGDELSDNGNGSYATNITGSPRNVYGFGTWTDGPVAVSYLADLLGVPLRDLAFGGCCGGGSSGATIDNNYTVAQAKVSGNPVPSVHDQVRTEYIGQAHPNIKNALEFIWVGENDLSEHTDAFWQGDPQNAQFAANISSRILAEAEYLVSNGAPYVFVANIYPKHRAPVTTKYLCSDGSCVDTWGAIIQQANTAIQESLAGSKYASKFIYYDVFTYMINLMNNKDANGLTKPLTVYCDGDANAQWDTCIAGSYTWQGAEQYYWMNFIQPTTHVHKLIAADMKTTIDKFFGH